MSLISRVTNITLRPKEEWPVIAAEPATAGSLYTGLIIPLAAIGPVCSFLSALAFGHRIPFTGIAVHVAVSGLFGAMVVSYLLNLVAVAVTAFIVQKLAPSFASTGDFAQSLKLVAYSQAPFWVAGVLYLIPFLGILAILVGLYSLYLAYLGLSPVMKTPPDKVVPYLIVVIVVSVVLWFAVAAISGALIGAGMIARGMA